MIETYQGKTLKIVFVLPLMLLSVLADAQCDNPPNGESCLCSTAPILCTPDELNGFQFSMSDEVNDGDLPTGGFFSEADLCPGIDNQDGFPNNVNFFAFIAWCEDLTLDVLVTNCLDNPDDNMNSYGIQMALFAGCGSQYNNWEPVACLTDGGDYCFNSAAAVPPVQTFVTSGLTIGNTYYFMLDGCARSTCDIEIDVIGTCGTGVIDPWTTGITGPDTVCVGTSYTYTVEDLDGAVEYYYYLDGALIADGTELTTIDYTFTTEGTYELCVDVSNLPCIEESADPGQTCITIIAAGPQVGTILATPQPTCPGTDVDVTVTGYSSDPAVSLVLYIVDETNTVVQVVMGDNTTATNDECEQWTAYAISYVLSFPPDFLSVGDSYASFNCPTGCCEEIDATFGWEDNDPPLLDNMPPDATVDCEDDIPTLEDVNYSDNCIGTGTLTPEIVENYTLCDGGSLTRTWMIADSCNTAIMHTQTITVDPIPAATFTDPPSSETVACADATLVFPELMLTNGATGACLISESITPSVDDTRGPCGGDIVATWMYTDLCNRPYEISQTITVEAPEPPTADATPADITLACGDPVPDPVMITFSNGGTGDCLLEEAVTASIVDNSTNCDGTIEYTWTYSDACGNDFSLVQVITITPPDAPVFTSMPGPETVSCDNIPGSPTDLMVDNGMTGPCQILDTVSPTVDDQSSACGGSITYLWEYTDICDRTISHTQVITVDPAPEGTFQDVPADITADCGDIAGQPVDLLFTNMQTGICLIEETVPATVSGTPDICGGDVIYTWTYTDDCGRSSSESQTVTFNPAPAPTWESDPQPITVECADFDPNPPPLGYNNGEPGDCNISGAATGTLLGTPGPCGEDVSYMWTHTDECDREIMISQSITILEADLPTFDNMPADVTINCNEVDPTPPTLTYSNGQTGDCERAGIMQAAVSGSYDACGGLLTYTWTATDECNYTITYSQNVTVGPADPPVFLDTPSDLVLGCDEQVPDPEPLSYDNGDAGPCNISGAVPPTVFQDGLVTTYTWTYTTDCTPATTITHVQTIQESSEPLISIDPATATICEGDIFDLSSITAIDLNGGTISTVYLDQNGQLINNPLVSPTSTTIYTIRIINEFLCEDDATFVLVVDSPPFPGVGILQVECLGTESINLFDLLSGPYGTGGTWLDPDFTGLNLNDPTQVNIINLSAGTYQFEYQLPSGNTCPPATTTGFLEIVSAPTLTIIDEECNDNSTAYTVTLIAVNGDISSSTGTVTSFPGNSYTVSDIPLTDAVTITVTDFSTGCSDEITVGPIICDCPDVPEPEVDGDLTICEDETTPPLTVTVPSGISAVWYETAAGGTSIFTGASFISPETNPGIYTYYVQAVDEQGCTSTLRVPIRLEIIARPTIMEVDYAACPDTSGQLMIDLLATVSPLANTNTSFTYQYYPTEADALASSNEILPPTISISTSTTLYVAITNPQGCATTGPVVLEPYALPDYLLLAGDESCINTDDGSITITTVSPPGTQYDLNGTDYNDTLLYQDLSPGNYQISAITTDGCVLQQTTSIAPGLQLSLSDIVILCDDNSTELDPSDDYYTVTFTANVPSNQIEVTGPAGVVTLLSTNPIAWEVPADPAAGSIDYVVTHASTGCSTILSTGPLTPCSTDCSFDLAPLTPLCNGNGSPTDPSDDFYTIEISATGVNGTSTSFLISVNNVTTAVGNYGTPQLLTLPANDSTATITITDSDDAQCFVSQVIGPLSPCSDACILDFSNYMAICNSNSTPGTPQDDYYDISFGFDATNPPSDSVIVTINGTTSSTYSYTEVAAIILPANGSIQSITITDQQDPTCSTTIDQDLMPCSGNCALTVSAQPAVCDINGTADVTEDDTYTALLTVSIVDGSSNWIIVSEGTTGITEEATLVGPYNIGDGDTTLIISDINNPSCADTIVILAPAPCSVCEGVVEAGVGGELTCDISAVTLTGSSTPMGQQSYWTNPGGEQTQGTSIQATSIGLYIYTVDYGDGCLISDSTEVTNDDSIPLAIGGPDQIFDCDTDSIVIVGTVSGGTGPYSYTWTDATGQLVSTEATLVVYQPGIYNLTVIDDATGCVSPVDGVTIIDEIAGPVAIIYPDPDNILDCVIEIIYLTSEQEENTIYQWTLNGQPVPSDNLSIAAAADITLVAIDTITGCQNSDSLQIVSLQEYPIIDIAPISNLDCDVTEVDIDASGSQSGTTISYTWYDEQGTVIAMGDNTPNITVTEEGSYVLELVDSDNGCSNTDTVMVINTGDFPNISLPTSMIVTCDATSAELSVDIDPDLTNINIVWTGFGGNILAGGSSPTATVDGPGSYTVMVTNIENGCDSEATIEVNYPDLISNVDILIEDESCTDNADGSITIALTTGGTPPYQYILDGETVEQPEILSLGAGTYQLQVIDSNNCEFDTMLVVDVLPAFDVQAPSQLLVQAESSQSITLITDIPESEIASIQWTPSNFLDCDTCLTVNYTAGSSQDYEVLLTDIYGCTAAASISITVVESVEVYVPNVFNPSSGTGGNNYFYPLSTEPAIVNTLQVYDRWGNLVFVNGDFPSNTPTEGWNGLFGDEAPVPGVYVYYMEVTFEGRPTEKIAGDITLIR